MCHRPVNINVRPLNKQLETSRSIHLVLKQTCLQLSDLSISANIPSTDTKSSRQHTKCSGTSSRVCGHTSPFANGVTFLTGFELAICALSIIYVRIGGKVRSRSTIHSWLKSHEILTIISKTLIPHLCVITRRAVDEGSAASAPPCRCPFDVNINRNPSSLIPLPV
jgi:hypothetical protein